MEGDGVKTSILYAIEVSDSMLAATGEGHSSLMVTLTTLVEFLKGIMISSPTTCMGILFYGVAGQPKGIHTFLPVQQQDSDGVKKLMRLVDDPKMLKSELQPGPYLLSDVLFACGQEFEKDQQKSLRRLVIVTDNDNPTGDDIKVASAAETRCEDLVEKGVVIDPVFITTEASPFNIQTFWDNLKYSQSGITLKTTKSAGSSVRAQVLAGGTIKRSAFRCNLKVQGTTVANIRGYNLYMPRKIPTPRQVYVEGTRQVVAETRSVNINEETGAEVPKEDVKRAFRLGDVYLPAISEEHMEQLRDFGEPEVNVIGTSSAQSLRFLGHRKHSIFLYPYEGDLQGSTRGFTALWQSLLKKGRYAVAQAIIRKNTSPFLCILVPTEVSYFTDAPTTFQQTPSGLHMIMLPYLDDVRQSPDQLGDPGAPNAQATEVFKEIITRLKMKRGFNPARYPNPSLNWVDQVIESTALSLPLPQGFEDLTLPSYNSIKKRAGELITKYIETFNIEPPAKRQKGGESSDESGGNY